MKLPELVHGRYRGQVGPKRVTGSRTANLSLPAERTQSRTRSRAQGAPRWRRDAELLPIPTDEQFVVLEG